MGCQESDNYVTEKSDKIRIYFNLNERTLIEKLHV